MDKAIEIRRQAVHMVLGVIIVILIFYGYLNAVWLSSFTVAGFLVLWIHSHRKIKGVEWILNNFEREDTVFRGKGVLFYLIGATLSLWLFKEDVAMASIVILAFGDGVPNLVSMYFGRIRHPFSDRKFIEGAIAGFIAAFAAACIFVAWYEALFGALAAVMLEGFDMKFGLAKIDDNLIVPLSAGIVISFVKFMI